MWKQLVNLGQQLTGKIMKQYHSNFKLSSLFTARFPFWYSDVEFKGVLYGYPFHIISIQIRKREANRVHTEITKIHNRCLESIQR